LTNRKKYDILRKKERHVDNYIVLVQKDRMFYEILGGRITFSGGEPMLWFDFSIVLLKCAKENGILA